MVQLGNFMDVSTLVKQLKEDAAQAMPPFGAESVKMARELGSEATGLLLPEIEARGETALLALEALREADLARYASLGGRERADIYVDALKNNVFYNAWGLPRYQLTPTARALIALGEDAVMALKPLLSDCRPAPLSGSEDATTSTMYGNRLCDYAWVLISEIMRRPYVYAQDPAERDRAIEALLQELPEKIGHE
jgi:hypothetical protein